MPPPPKKAYFPLLFPYIPLLLPILSREGDEMNSLSSSFSPPGLSLL